MKSLIIEFSSVILFACHSLTNTTGDVFLLRSSNVWKNDADQTRWRRLPRKNAARILLPRAMPRPLARKLSDACASRPNQFFYESQSLKRLFSRG